MVWEGQSWVSDGVERFVHHEGSAPCGKCSSNIERCLISYQSRGISDYAFVICVRNTVGVYDSFEWYNVPKRN